MKIVEVVGARPQFIKLAPVDRALRADATTVIVHTGQHYDPGMSAVFFDGLGIPAPDYNLDVRSGSHGAQTGEMLRGLEEVLLREAPDVVVVFGDTNSTLAAALAAAKLLIPVAHVEAGLRSLNRSMPEEINRVVTDHVSTLLYAPTQTAVECLAREGIVAGVELVGDVMYDAVLANRGLAASSSILSRLSVVGETFALLTVHRAGNTDDVTRLAAIVRAANALPFTVVFPVHPRTRGRLAEAGIELAANVHPCDPVDYVEMLALQLAAAVVLTDSGGLQKEAFFLGTPCVTLREETEWTETVDAGWNVLVGTDTEAIVAAATTFRPVHPRPNLFGDGTAAERIRASLHTGLPR